MKKTIVVFFLLVLFLSLRVFAEENKGFQRGYTQGYIQGQQQPRQDGYNYYTKEFGFTSPNSSGYQGYKGNSPGYTPHQYGGENRGRSSGYSGKGRK